MKKLTKLMTAAGCALLIGGGLSLYAATRASGEVQPLAADTYPAAILYASGMAALDGGDATSAFSQGDHYLAFNYNAEDKSAADLVEQPCTKDITVTKTGDPSFTKTITGSSLGVRNNGNSYVIREGYLNSGSALFFMNNIWWEFGPGEYTFAIPEGLVEFSEGGTNSAIDLTFSILGTMGATWDVESDYIPTSNLENGVSFTFPDATTVSVVDESAEFTVKTFEGEQWAPQNPQETKYPGSSLTISGNKVTLPGLDNIEDGLKVLITFPSGYFKGSSPTANYLSGELAQLYTVWGGMPATVTVVTQIPAYVTEVDDITMYWRGQTIHVADKYASGTTIPVNVSGPVFDQTANIEYSIEAGEDGYNYLTLKNVTQSLDINWYQTENQKVQITLPENVVENEDNLGNLSQQIASFSLVRLWGATQFTPQISVDDSGIVTLSWNQYFNDMADFGDLYNINIAPSAPQNLVQVLDESENVVLSINKSDLTSFVFSNDNPAVSGFKFDISKLLPNNKYNIVINPLSFKVFTTAAQYYYNPEITGEVDFSINLEGNGLGKGTLYPLTGYFAAPEYNQPATNFIVQWDGDIPVKVYDPTKISGKVKGLPMTGITVEATTYPVNGLRVNIPEAYQSNYCEFTFTLEPELVYDSNQSNETTEISFETYGSISSDYAKVSPAAGQVTSEELSQIEITWEGFENMVDEMTFTKGKGEISVRIGTAQNPEPIDPQYITYEKDKLVIDLSYLNITNQAYSINVSTGAVVVSTDMGNNWINSLVTVDYNVWDGMEEAEVEGLNGMVSEETALASDGIYTLTWGKNVTPTDDFKVTFNFMAGSFSGNEVLTQDAFTFLNENMQPVANWSEGGLYLQMNAKELIETKIGEEFTLFWFTIDAGSVEGGSATAINPRQQFGVFQIQELAEKEATISGPEDGIVTIAWPSSYWVASINNAPGIQLLNSNGELVGEWSFTTEEWKSPLVRPDEESPLQFVIASGDYACGFELNLNALDLPFDTYTVVLPEGTLYLVDTNMRNVDTYSPPINAPQTSDPFEFGAYPAYEGEITIIPEVGTVAELTTVTVTFVDATSVKLVENPYVNGNQMTEGFTVEGNVITIVPGINEDGEVTVTIPAGAVIIDRQFTNEDAIVATYTIDMESGIAGIYAVDGRYEVYTVNGVLVLSTKDASDLNKLENGLYIINGQKVYIRK